MSALDGMICGVNPDKAYARLEQLMAERDAVIPPPGASRDSPEFAAFMAAENRVGAFIAAHEHELAALRLPRDGMTAGRYEAKLAEMDAELDWLAERAEPGTAAQEAYSAGGIPLKRNKDAGIHDPVPVSVPYPRKELIYRLRKHWCELCGQGATVDVHQVASLAQLGRPGPGQPGWAAIMARKRRKTLVVCRSCHEVIHATPVANAA